MLFKRHLIRELSTTAIASFAILLAILVVVQLVKLLAKASGGEFPFEAAFTLLGFVTLRYTPIVLILTLYLSVLIVLQRQYKDHEMAIWFSSGQSLGRWLSPIIGFALPFVLIIAAISLWIAPWAEQASKQYSKNLSQNSHFSSSLSPGVFKTSKDGAQVYFVERFNIEQRQAQHLFVQTERDGQRIWILARQGGQSQAKDGSQWLALEQGHSYTQSPSSFEQVAFNTLQLRLPTAARVKDDSIRAQSTADLLARHDANAHAQLMWRISLIIAALLLPLLAIPLSFYNPRGGRNYNLLLALLAYMLYYNLMGVVENKIEDQKINAWVGAGLVHGLMLVSIAGLLAWRLGYWRRTPRNASPTQEGGA